MGPCPKYRIKFDLNAFQTQHLLLGITRVTILEQKSRKQMEKIMLARRKCGNGATISRQYNIAYILHSISWFTPWTKSNNWISILHLWNRYYFIPLDSYYAYSWVLEWKFRFNWVLTESIRLRETNKCHWIINNTSQYIIPLFSFLDLLVSSHCVASYSISCSRVPWMCVSHSGLLLTNTMYTCITIPSDRIIAPSFGFVFVVAVLARFI